MAKNIKEINEIKLLPTEWARQKGLKEVLYVWFNKSGAITEKKFEEIK